MSNLIYYAFTKLFPIAVKAASPFHHKARLWTQGRSNIFDRLQQSITPGSNIIWMHCASLGEFEQGRPVIERLKRDYTDYEILLTFFSPSGYEVRKDYKGADWVFYLPMDSEANATRFFEIVKPTLAIFVKYEFWFYYLNEARRRKVPLLLVSGIFRKTQQFFAKSGHFHRQMLRCFTHLFVQNQLSLELLTSIGLSEKVSVAGDTRFDRVIEIAEQFEPIALIEKFVENSNTIVAGSTWSEDDKVLSHFANANPSVKIIIAPHNIDKDRISECLRLYKNAILFSSLQNQMPGAGINTLIIDNVGMLSKLYKYGTITYVGGGFGSDGVHNVLEAAVYGKPVVFGPEYEKYIEAIELVETNGGTSIENTMELEAEFKMLLQKDGGYHYKCKASLDYVYSKRGSTDKIIDFIYANRLLTN